MTCRIDDVYRDTTESSVATPGAIFVVLPCSKRSAQPRTGSSIDLRSIWPRATFIERMSEASEPSTKLRVLDSLLQERAERAKCGSIVVAGAIRLLTDPNATVSACARLLGFSERWLSQLFREEVGVAPKLWCRIQRFQAAVSGLHRGADIRWAELALRCGYYDQAHFIKDFRAFSGVNPTTYSVHSRVWKNHLALD